MLLIARADLRRDCAEETETVPAAKYLARFVDDPSARSGLDLIAANGIS